MQQLNKEQKKSLVKASSAQLNLAFQRVENNFVNSRWLDPSNVYNADILKTLVDHTQSGHAVHDQDLSEYIAASALLHCTDGWALLGRALDSHARGDSSTTVHLGYYVELRAAMSLLANPVCKFR